MGAFALPVDVMGVTQVFGTINHINNYMTLNSCTKYKLAVLPLSKSRTFTFLNVLNVLQKDALVFSIMHAM